MSYNNFTTTTSFESGDITVSSSVETPTAWCRRLIRERTNSSNVIPHFYRQVLQYFISKLGTLSYINSETKVIPVKCIHANPERTIAKLKQETNIILPIISISQNSSNNADERRRGAPQLINETFWSEKKRRAVRVVSEAPRAVDIDLNINVWAKYKADIDQLIEQIRLLFNPHLVIKTEYSDVAMAYIENEQDQSTLETADRQERIVRRSFTIKLEGYIPSPKFIITSTGQIEEFNLEASIYEKK